MIRVGVIGTGHIGTEHIRRLTNVISNSKVTMVSDISQEVSAHILQADKSITFTSDPLELIHSNLVDAVLITCSNNMHAPYTLEAVRIRKPVFCEKPLGETPEQIKEIMDLEIITGKHLVNVGFMRRFDDGYKQIKDVIRSREMGDPLIAYCCHRNPGDWVGRLSMTDERAVIGTAIHEIDVMSWLFDEPFIGAQAIIGKSNSDAKNYDGFHDPVILTMKTVSGILVVLEVNMIARFGYDIQCKVLCERGTVEMPDAPYVTKRFENKISKSIDQTWKTRFNTAFDREIQAWIDSIASGQSKNVATAWDAYRAAIMTKALIKAEKTGAFEYCGLPECPEFYQ